MSGSKFIKFIIYTITLITFLGLINAIFDLHRYAFYGEFLVLIGMGIIAIISSMGINNNARWGWMLLKIFFIIAFVNLIFINAITTASIPYFMYLVIVAIVGFFISFFGIKKPKTKKVMKEVKKTFTPGKFIASKTGAKFHAPKCDWAKKIKKKNAVWLNSKEEAKKAGYKADSCVK